MVIVGSASTAIAGEKKVVYTLQIQSPLTIVHILTCRGYRDNLLILTKLLHTTAKIVHTTTTIFAGCLNILVSSVMFNKYITKCLVDFMLEYIVTYLLESFMLCAICCTPNYKCTVPTTLFFTILSHLEVNPMFYYTIICPITCKTCKVYCLFYHQFFICLIRFLGFIGLFNASKLIIFLD